MTIDFYDGVELGFRAGRVIAEREGCSRHTLSLIDGQIEKLLAFKRRAKSRDGDIEYRSWILRLRADLEISSWGGA